MGFGNDQIEKQQKAIEKQMNDQIAEQDAQVQERIKSISQERLRIIKSQFGGSSWYNPPATNTGKKGKSSVSPVDSIMTPSSSSKV